MMEGHGAKSGTQGEIQTKSSLTDPNTTSENIHLHQALQQCGTVSKKK